MGGGKLRNKAKIGRQFSSLEDILAGTSSSSLPVPVPPSHTCKHREEEEEEEEEQKEFSHRQPRRKGTEGLIEIENPNLVPNPKTTFFKPTEEDDDDDDDDNIITKTTTTTELLSRREREEIHKQRARQRYMRLQEQGKTEQARKDLERLCIVRQQRAEAATKREEQKAALQRKKAQARNK